jgi:sortase A
VRHRLWLGLLVLGLAISAKPAGRRVKRLWLEWTARMMWADARQQPAPLRNGEPYAWLNIPAAGIDLLVVNGASEPNLSHFPCREQVGSATLVMAHRDTHFQGLENLSIGDAFTLELRRGELRRFQCLEIHVVDKKEVEALIQTQSGEDRLLLLTCHPFRHIGPAPRRFLVVAGPLRNW